jgi:hypothetical protein
VIVEVTGELLTFVPVKDVMLPVPLEARPIDVLLFTQLYKVAAPLPLKVIALTAVPLHTVSFDGPATVGVGFTIIVNTCGVPKHVTALNVYSGVTVIVAVTGTFVILVAVKDGIVLLVPLAAKPILIVLLVQL